MPWSVVKKDNLYCIAKDSDKSIVKGSCHNNRQDTARMLRALYANEEKHMKDNLIYFGEAVKALDDSGRVGGYLVKFTDASQKDLDGEYFTAETYYGPKEGDGEECLFDHGFAVPADRFIKDVKQGEMAALSELADRTFAPLKTKRDAVGIFAETVLNLEDEYEKFIFSRVKKGRIGWSSGSPGHRVKKEADGRIARWPICEGSLTPRPAQPLSRAIAMKSFAAVKFVAIDTEDDEPIDDPKVKASSLSTKLNQYIDDLIDDGGDKEALVKSIAREALCDRAEIEAILDGSNKRPSDVRLKAFARVLSVSIDALRNLADPYPTKTIKGMFQDAMTDSPGSRLVLDAAFCKLVSNVAAIAVMSKATDTDFDLEGKVNEIVSHHADATKALVLASINDHIDTGSDEPFYLKAVTDITTDLDHITHIDLDTHSQVAVSAARGYAKRLRGNHEARVKAGRVLSERNRQRVENAKDELMAVISSLDDLLSASTPMASDSEKRAAISQHLRLEQRARQLGLPAN
jgi:hypothetical protein